MSKIWRKLPYSQAEYLTRTDFGSQISISISLQNVFQIHIQVKRLKGTKKGKKTPESLTCRFCPNDLPKTQKHLEICDGTKFERRGVWVSEVMGRVIFWRRMTQKITHKTATVTSTPEVHLSDAPGGGSGCIQLDRVDYPINK